MADNWDDEAKVQQAVPVPPQTVPTQTAEKKPEKKVCFCIMPVTVPKGLEAYYSGGLDHFPCVFKTLFEPAVRRLGGEWTAEFPQFDGSGILHRSIVDRLRTADLCLADVSCLKPNVYLEIGIRLALDLPLALVRDETVETIPFDAGSLGHLAYQSQLSAFLIESQIEKLTAHLKRTLERYEANDTFLVAYGGIHREYKGVSEEVQAALNRLENGQRDLSERLTAVEGPLSYRRSVVPSRVRESALREPVALELVWQSDRDYVESLRNDPSVRQLSESYRRASEELRRVGETYPGLFADAVARAKAEYEPSQSALESLSKFALKAKADLSEAESGDKPKE